jgi:hypothetical protein
MNLFPVPPIDQETDQEGGDDDAIEEDLYD